MILFGNDAFEALRNQMAKGNYSSVWVLVDGNTKAACWPLLEKELSGLSEIRLLEIEAGEPHKNIETCQSIWHQLLAGQADRKALLLNLGGGVIGDMGGFCAATYKRGMDFVQIPTTLLSQVDASVGGKMGIDFGRVKNAIGVFQIPLMVCIHPIFLKTLPLQELYSGFAEIIKHALIADAAHWERLQKITDLRDENVDWADLIAHSVSIKSQVVEQDPTEKGLRKILNFGHTIGHAIESMSWESNKPLLHGEAVAIGMICEAYLSHKILGLSATALSAIEQYISAIYPRYDLSTFDTEALLQLMYQDKKNEGKGIAFSLLSAIGASAYNVEVEPTMIMESLAYYTK